MKLSVIIPAHNEEANIGPCLDELISKLDEERVDFEIVVVNDNSSDRTEQEVTQRAMSCLGRIRLIRRQAPGGFGRAIRTGLQFVQHPAVVIYMADRSDHPSDAIKYLRKLEEGYDCVFGSRFIDGSRVENYPRLKLWVNRCVNISIQWMFWTKFNDMTNAFKAYRSDVLRRCGPFRSCHFNITLELSLSALIAGYKIAQVPIEWQGRTWGSSNLRLSEMGRRYLCTLLMLFFQRILMSDDAISERERNPSLGDEVDIRELRSEP